MSGFPAMDVSFGQTCSKSCLLTKHLLQEMRTGELMMYTPKPSVRIVKSSFLNLHSFFLLNINTYTSKLIDHKFYTPEKHNVQLLSFKRKG